MDENSEEYQKELEEIAKKIELGHIGIPTRYDKEIKPITLTDFMLDVFGIDLNKIKKKIKNTVKRE